tara:strand:+ start:1487 stop:1912 length:426 start_codon:yes stop_codon:yes gene_type:complete
MVVAEYDDMMDTMRRGAQTQEACPPATGNIQLNMENRQKPIDEANYGPANPALDETGENQEFWQTYADKFNDSVENVMTMRCGGCTFFDQSPEILECIELGLGDEADPEAAIEGGDLGYCDAFDFKCASMRVCFSWAGRQE